MIAPIGKALGEGNCARVTEGGKEAGAKAARLRTETSYEAGSTGRVSTTSLRGSQPVDEGMRDRGDEKAWPALSLVRIRYQDEVCVLRLLDSVPPGAKENRP